jgi:hypothetical protein
MKSMRIIVGLSAILSVFMVLSCGKDDDSTTGPDIVVPSELIATWTYQSATINEIPVSLGLVLGWEEGTVSARFTVDGDGTFVYEELDSEDSVLWTESGTIAISGNEATITITSDSEGPVDPPDVMSGTWALDGNELTLTTTMEGLTVVLVATK